MKLSNRHAVFLLAVLFIAQTVEVLAFHLPLGWTWQSYDAHELVVAPLLYREYLQGTLTISDFLPIEHHFGDQPPPVFHLIQLAYLVVAGTSDGLILISLLPVLVLGLCLYCIARTLMGRTASLCAVLVVLSFRGTMELITLRLGVELFAAAGVCLCLCLLLSANYFQNRAHSALLGVGLGIALLTKFTVVPFLAGPITVSIAIGLRNAPAKRRLILVNVVLAATIAALVAALWYAFRLDTILWYIGKETDAPTAIGYANIMANIVAFFVRLSRELGCGLGPLFLVSAILFVATRSYAALSVSTVRTAAILAMTFLPPACLLVMLRARFIPVSEYIEFPSMAPFFAVVTCYLVFRQKNRWLRTGLVVAVLVACIANRLPYYPMAVDEVRESRARNSGAKNAIAALAKFVRKRDCVYIHVRSDESKYFTAMFYQSNWKGLGIDFQKLEKDSRITPPDEQERTAMFAIGEDEFSVADKAKGLVLITKQQPGLTVKYFLQTPDGLKGIQNRGRGRFSDPEGFDYHILEYKEH